MRRGHLVTELVEVDEEVVLRLEVRVDTLLGDRPHRHAVESGVRQQVLFDEIRLCDVVEGALVGGCHVALDLQVVDDVDRLDAARGVG